MHLLVGIDYRHTIVSIYFLRVLRYAMQKSEPNRFNQISPNVGARICSSVTLTAASVGRHHRAQKKQCQFILL